MIPQGLFAGPSAAKDDTRGNGRETTRVVSIFYFTR